MVSLVHACRDRGALKISDHLLLSQSLVTAIGSDRFSLWRDLGSERPQTPPLHFKLFKMPKSAFNTFVFLILHHWVQSKQEVTLLPGYYIRDLIEADSGFVWDGRPGQHDGVPSHCLLEQPNGSLAAPVVKEQAFQNSSLR